jgi:endonuclease YncB( thermonuclease family)
VIRILRSFRAWAFLLVLAALAFWLERQGSETISGSSGGGSAIHVIDGDSLRVAGREIRLAGIDAPEYRQTCTDEKGAAWPCGREARLALERLAGAGDLQCETAVEDRYGRALARCRAGGMDIAEALARQGWADGAGDSRFAEPSTAIAEAKRAKRGIWRGGHSHPGEWRKANAGT